MVTCTALKSDLAAIQELLAQSGTMTIGPEHLNKHDIAVVAWDGPSVVGFMWGGRMARGKVLYLDKLVVHHNYRGRGVAQALSHRMLAEAKKRGVVEVQTIVRQDEHFSAAAINGLKMALQTDGYNYTFLQGNIAFIDSEVSRGR